MLVDIRRAVRKVPRRWLLALVFLVSLGAYLSGGPRFYLLDSQPASLLPIALLIGHSLAYDGIIAGLGPGKPPSAFRQTKHGLVSMYPVATGLLALPIYAPVMAIKALISPPSLEGWIRFAGKFQQVPAAIFAALAVLAFWRLCEAAELSPVLSFALTLWLAFGSELFSTASQVLWQHGPGTLAAIVAMDAQSRLRRRPLPSTALILSAFCGLAIAVRPTNLLVAGPFGLAALLENPRLWVHLLVPGLTLGGLLLAYNLYFFGDLLGGYDWAPGLVGAGDFSAGLLGLLFSPGRGLLVYFLVLAPTATALALRPSTLLESTAAAAICAAVVTTLLVASYGVWWGGWCYGPRYLSEIQPAVLLLMGLALRRMGAKLQRRFLIAVFAILPYGVLVQAVGTYTGGSFQWNASPVSVDSDPARVWDIADNPIFRGLRLSRPASL